MKALIVEDNRRKQIDVIQLLKKYNIEELTVEKFVAQAIIEAQSTKFDILVTDLGLPRFIDLPIIEDEREGLKMLFDLERDDIKIPALIYSTTDLYEHHINYLEEIEYPIYGQAKNIEELESNLVYFLSGKTEPILPIPKSDTNQRNKVKRKEPKWYDD